MQISVDLKEKFRTTIQVQYGYETRTNTENRLVTDAWDSLQRKVKHTPVTLIYTCMY